MSDSEQQDVPEYWLRNSNERIRMLRYFVREQPITAQRLLPEYPSEPKIGAVIGTYGCVPYVDLNLHYLINVNHIPVLVHDDCSTSRDELLELCKRYHPHACLFTPTHKLWHQPGVGSIGDTSCFLVGLNWANQMKLDILVKFSRRFVCVSEFATKLRKLALDSDAFTFGLDCPRYHHPLRTECMAMNVRIWGDLWVCHRLNAAVQRQVPLFADFWFNDMARTIAYYNGSAKYRKFMKQLNRGPMFDAYVPWPDLTGPSRYEKNPNALWHQSNLPEDYAAAADKVFPGRYTAADFKNVPGI
ncbi:MAG: hypothetical protein AB7F40_05490 [Victivallaceae bacterium]|nr:hypothetical protein [Victivallaceae bacterium]